MSAFLQLTSASSGPIRVIPVRDVKIMNH